MKIIDKQEFKNTISAKFKQDMIDFFRLPLYRPQEGKLAVELGTSHGHTTHILAELFDKVITFDWKDDNKNKAEEFNKDHDNIIYYVMDVYRNDWTTFIHEQPTLLFVDCVHDFGNVCKDIERGLTLKPKYWIFDDYGHSNTGVKQAVSQYSFRIVKNMGHPKGSIIQENGYPLKDCEGILAETNDNII